MTRLIDADELQKALARMWYDSPISITGISVSALIDEQPTIEAEPVKHGRWFDLRDCANQGTYCSVCKAKIFDTPMPHKKKLSNYCPNCGARMEVEND